MYDICYSLCLFYVLQEVLTVEISCLVLRAMTQRSTSGHTRLSCCVPGVDTVSQSRDSPMSDDTDTSDTSRERLIHRCWHEWQSVGDTILVTTIFRVTLTDMYWNTDSDTYVQNNAYSVTHQWHICSEWHWLTLVTQVQWHIVIVTQTFQTLLPRAALPLYLNPFKLMRDLPFICRIMYTL